MIVDKIKNAKLYYGIDKNIQKALKFLEENDLKSFENGRYEIEKDEIFVIIQKYQSKLSDDAQFEAHKKYTDIQFIIEGKEQLGYANIDDFCPETNYDSQKDLVFGSANGSFVNAKEGDFIIFTPQDAHMPGICFKKPSLVKKAVVKVLLGI